MKVTIEATPEEIAALVAALQARRSEGHCSAPLDIIRKAVRSAIDDAGKARPLSL